MTALTIMGRDNTKKATVEDTPDGVRVTFLRYLGRERRGLYLAACDPWDVGGVWALTSTHTFDEPFHRVLNHVHKALWGASK